MVLSFPSGDIFVLSLFTNEVSTVATVICGFANTNTLSKVKFKLGTIHLSGLSSCIDA